MCKYRYHYYSQCQHQELLCFELCERAGTSLNDADQVGEGTLLERTTGDQGDHTDTPPLSDIRDLSSTITPANGSFIAPQQVAAGTIHHDPSFTIHHHPLTSTINHRSHASWSPLHTQQIDAGRPLRSLKSCVDVRIATPLTSKVQYFSVAVLP